MEKEKGLIICYGSKNVTLNRGDEHMSISRSDLAFIVRSAITNNEVVLEVFSKEKNYENI